MKKFFSTSEVAKLCNVHRNTIINAIKAGTLKAHKTPGGHSRIVLDDLKEFCKSKGFNIQELFHSRTKILIIDDDRNIVEILADGLELEGFDVVSAQNGFDAGLLTIDFMPDVIILDVLVPEINCEILCKRVKSHAKTKTIKIIAVSSVQNPMIEKQIIDAGADIFLTEHLELNAILDVLKNLKQDNNHIRRIRK